MRNVLTTGILAAAMALGTVACEDPPPPPKPTKPATPAKPAKTAAAKPKPKKLTPQQKADMVKKCWAAWDAKDEKKFGECYSAKTTFEMVDYLPPIKGKGLQKNFASFAPLRKAFPDFKHEIGMIFVRGNDIVTLYSAHGTNKGEWMGQKATEKPIGYLAAQHARMAPDGTVAMDHHFADQSTFAGQLGLHKTPVRTVRKAGEWGETKVVIAKNDKKEKENLSAFRKLGKDMKEKDLDKIMAHYADDAVFSYQAGPEDNKGKDAIRKSMDMWFKMSTDAKDTVAWTWAAGDYVLAESKTTGTNDGPPMPGKEATNKKFTMRELVVLKYEEGKIKEHWMFANGYKFAVDLGLAEPPEDAVAKKDGDDKKDDKAADKGKDAPKDKAAGAKPEPPKPSTPKKE